MTPDPREGRRSDVPYVPGPEPITHPPYQHPVSGPPGPYAPQHPPHSAPPYPGYPVSVPVPPPPQKRPMSAGMALLVALGLSVAILFVGGLFVTLTDRSVAPPRPAPPVAADPTTPAATSVKPTMATVPNVIGKNCAVAGDELERAGFEEVNYGSVDVGETVVLPSNWWVAEQSHPAGQTIPTDTLIVLGCTKKRP